MARIVSMEQSERRRTLNSINNGYASRYPFRQNGNGTKSKKKR